MKEVKDVKNVDKIIESVTKKTGKGIFGGAISGIAIATIIIACIGIYFGISLQILTVAYKILACAALATGLIGGGVYLKDKIDAIKLEKVFEEVKTQTGVELDVESAEVALEKTDVNVRTSFDEEKTHDIEEREVIKRFYMLDKNEQMQVLECVRKTVKDHMGKTSTQSLSILEEEEKNAIDYVGVKKELKFIPKTPIIKED